jgi:hypothetical protein
MREDLSLCFSSWICVPSPQSISTSADSKRSNCADGFRYVVGVAEPQPKIKSSGRNKEAK